MSGSRKRKLKYASYQTVHTFPTNALQGDTVKSVTVSETVSSDRHRVKRATVPVYTPSQPAAQDPTDAVNDEPESSSSHTFVDLADVLLPAQTRGKSRRNNYYVSTVRLDSRSLNRVAELGLAQERDAFLQEWILQQDTFLDEMLRLEGLRDASARSCAACWNEGQLYRCADCTGDRLLCGKCCLAQHVYLPFHVIEVSAPDSRVRARR